MSDYPWRFNSLSIRRFTFSSSVNSLFRCLWVVEKMWVVLVPAACALSSIAVYRQTKSPFYSFLSSFCCGIVWLTSRYYILGRVPIFLSPQFKECTSVVRLLLHNINTKLLKKYSYRHPLIINLGVLTKFHTIRCFKSVSSESSYIDEATALSLSRFIDFAAASYGVLFYPKHVGSYLRNALKSGGLNPYSISTSTVSVNVISEMTGVSPDDIIMTRLKGENPLRPGYYICLDHSSRSVVLAVRGTLTLSDTLTDIACLSKEFVGGWAHHGISVSADTIYTETRVILENTVQETGYDLVLCGHSLGAGTAVLLALYLLENRTELSAALSACKISCYAFAPPPVFNPGERDTVEKWSENIVTVVNGTDIIPRASLANTFSLLLQLQYIERLKLSLWERCALIIDKQTDRLSNLMEGMEDFLRRESEDLGHIHEVFRPLYHVGRILWLDKIVSSQPHPDTSHPTYKILGESHDDNTYSEPGVQSRNKTNDISHCGDSDSENARLNSPLSDDSGIETLSTEQSSLLNQNNNDSVMTHIRDIIQVESNSTRAVAVHREPITVHRAVILQQNEFEWERIHIGTRFIADHWPHEYQKTLKLLASQFSCSE